MDKKIFIAIGIGVAAIAALLISSSIPQEDVFVVQQKNDKLGIIVNTPTQQVTLDQIKKTYSRADESGAGRTNLYLFWNHVEPEQEKYNFRDTDVLMSLNKNNGMQTTLYLSIVNGRTIGPYPTWMGTPGFGTLLETKATTTLDAILTRYDGAIDSVIIGAELDSYFDDADGSVNLYRESFNNIYSELKQKHPDVKMGNAFSLNNVLNKNLTRYVSEFADTGDFVAFTYLPVDRINDITKTPAQARADLQKALDMVPNNQVVFFELSWSTAQDIGGSEQGQEEFIKTAYEFYRENQSKIEFFNWYRIYDRPDGSCVIDQKFAESQVSLTNNDQYVRERLGNYICNAGLLKTDDSAKSGWDELKKQIGSS
ncbi:hypothetical protein [Candidatus Nitrosotenuis aquarius]|uniref:hypothetical protein n=1 Tax=Candidatus Nitrosotenuis aquarius TaxID=1846278 RepID=UPI000C1E4937|nr:hypothetical protein [Candidatus Nitrosotenuis aquarius]